MEVAFKEGVLYLQGVKFGKVCIHECLKTKQKVTTSCTHNNLAFEINDTIGW